ncbi:hypothetical protein HPP92_022539 [Vanilla planifolia]|uniref:BAG domain-containing protein n=1 Tax=Vanilla planifolia TaxID=51239 RepID=A0A835PSD1_VANPL|nr:hypothetical protein HPP92_022539 [Vanilla planifolia]
MNSVFVEYTSSYFCFSENDETTPSLHPRSVPIPVDSPSHADGNSIGPIPIPVRLPSSIYSAAAVKIQSCYRGRLTRVLVSRIRAAASEADRLEHLIRQRDTVDAVRRDPRERLMLDEQLMAALLRLDGVPGFYPSVRDLRRIVSRRIVGLQELLDAIAATPALDSPDGIPVSLEGIPASLEEILGSIWDQEGERDDVEWSVSQVCIL